MNNIQIFNSPEFGQIRTVTINDEPWLVGKDVAQALGYQNASKALADHVDEDDKLNNETLSSLGQRGGWLINESGLYSLVLSSKLPTAKKFRRWVTSEVLPSIRKNGGYIAGQEDMSEEVLMAKAILVAQKTIESMKERTKFLATELEQKANLIEELQPKATYYDLILQCKDLLTTSDIAKDYGMTAQSLNKLLHKEGVQFKQSGRWFLYHKYDGFGYVHTKTHSFINKQGSPESKLHMYWTQKGRLFLYDFLKERGILPEIEQEESTP